MAPSWTKDRHTQRRRCSVGHRGASERCGFTIVDLLVSISVVAILISLLAPGLMQSYEMARRVVCSSNVRQIGYAMDMYLDDHADKLPTSVFIDETNGHDANEVHNSIYVRVDRGDNVKLKSRAVRLNTDITRQWDGLGILFEMGYLTHPGVYYCPSHHGGHSFEEYEESWARSVGTIAGNYQFRIDPQYRLRSDLPPNLTIIADSMRTVQDYNHKVGNHLLRADMSVRWFQDVDGSMLAALGEDGEQDIHLQSSVAEAWEVLDDGLVPTNNDSVGPLTAGSGN